MAPKWTSATTDSNGHTHLSGGVVQSVRYVDLTNSRFANPVANNFVGADKTGQYYYNGVPCAFGDFGTVASGLRKTAWANSDEEPLRSYNRDELGSAQCTAQSITIPTDGKVRLSTTRSAGGGSDANAVSLSSYGKWWLDGDFEIEFHYTNHTQTSGYTNGSVYLYGSEPGTNIGGSVAERTQVGFQHVYSGGAWTGRLLVIKDNSVITYDTGATLAMTGAAGGISIKRASGLYTLKWYNGAFTVWTTAVANHNPGGSVATSRLFAQIQHMIFTTDTGNTSCDWTVNLVSGATVSTPTWPTEAEGTHRGPQTEVPDHLLVITDVEGVQILDADTEELFFRHPIPVETGNPRYLEHRGLIAAPQDLFSADFIEGELVVLGFDWVTNPPIYGNIRNGLQSLRFVDGEWVRFPGGMLAHRLATSMLDSSGAATVGDLGPTWYGSRALSPDAITRKGVAAGGVQFNDWATYGLRGMTHPGSVIETNHLSVLSSALWIEGTTPTTTWKWYLVGSTGGLTWIKEGWLNFGGHAVHPWTSASNSNTWCASIAAYNRVYAIELDSAGNLFWTNGTTIYSCAKATWQAAADAAPNARFVGSFAANTTKARSGTWGNTAGAQPLTRFAQRRLVLTGTYGVDRIVWWAADEGIYRCDWPGGIATLEYGVAGSGATYEIIPAGLVRCNALCYDDSNDRLVFSILRAGSTVEELGIIALGNDPSVFSDPLIDITSDLGTLPLTSLDVSSDGLVAYVGSSAGASSLDLPEVTPPTITPISPEDADIGISVDTTISLTLADSGSGINNALGSVSVSITGISGPYVDMWTGVAGFQSGYDGAASALTGTPASYVLTIDPTSDFSELTEFFIQYEIFDNSGNSSTGTYSFTTESLTPVPVDATSPIDFSFDVSAIQTRSNLPFKFNVESTSFIQRPIPVQYPDNPFTHIGKLVSLKRSPEEKNAAYRRRVMDIYSNMANSTYTGMVNGITRELGLSLFQGIEINPKTDVNGNFLASDPLVIFNDTSLLLYSNYANRELDWAIDRLEKGGNYEHLGTLVDFINNTSFFEAALRPNVEPFIRSSTILNQTSRATVDFEYVKVSTKFRLKKWPIVNGSIFFSNPGVFATRKLTAISVSVDGDYHVDNNTGIVTVAMVPGKQDSVRYQYTKYPFYAMASPIVIHDINSVDFKRKMFEQIFSDDENDYVNGLPTELGVDIINELLSVSPMYWGK